MTTRCCPTPGSDEKREAIVQDCPTPIDNNPVYSLITKINGKMNSKFFFYCPNRAIDDHYLIRIFKEGQHFDQFHDSVAAVVDYKHIIPRKLYETAMKYARCRVDWPDQIQDETRIGKESRLVQTADKMGPEQVITS